MNELHASTFAVVTPDGGRVATVVLRPLVDAPPGWTPVPRDLVLDANRRQRLLDLAHLWSGSVAELFETVRSSAAA